MIRKTIFITGAASGMGLAAARRFAREGWAIGAADVNGDGLQALLNELGPENCKTYHLDVRDHEIFNDAVTDFVTSFGDRLDLLFNNAGIGSGGPFEAVPHQVSMDIVDINLRGVINGAYAAFPHLQKTPGSMLFNNASSSATYGMPGLAVYSATKHGVKGLTEALSLEWRAHDIRVADSLPGLINTPLLLNAKRYGTNEPAPTEEEFKAAAPKKGAFRLIEPEEVADAVWDAYNDKGGKLHWYVPKGIGMIDRIKGVKPEWARGLIGRNLDSLIGMD